MNAIGTPLTDLINSGNDPIVVNCILEIDATSESGGHASKYQIKPEGGECTAGTRRDGPTRLARPTCQARTGTENDSSSLFS